ncbi:MAG: hypothetical protein AW10_03235 [Candidatus Accumulibacter appositus]|uniref:DUF2802 domain-containing protein n=1 Tax=Candidatus Accumulibacter appositus TaxID=1454003 RepID=A0A011PMA0_9PROT|nr:DUF2802 domain-containing protein [Accumulibacter sp.]EXI78152.1 MAG: hypothetical protein AW10_03235 [Candidatus Accumulibacter appositus]HRF04722.1 DUF2802 domain-containing protein [Accumulibacter sp.]
MDFELLGSLGWREGLILVIVLLLSYIVILFLRMRRLQNERGAAVAPLLAQSALAAYTGIQETDAAVAGAPAPAPAVAGAKAEAGDSHAAAESAPLAGAAEAAPPIAAEELDFAWNEPPPEIPGQALIEALQEDVYQLRCEVDDLREGLLAAREDFRHQLAQMSQIAESSAQVASPLYNDAMQMATQGQDAATIAQHCGIARAEADLVVALVRNRNDGS